MLRRPAILLPFLFAASAVAQPAEFLPETLYAIGGASYDVRSVDLNGDGAPDLVSSAQGDGGVSVLINQGDGTFSPSVFYLVASGIRSVAIGDFDGDGHPDVVASANVNTIWFLPGAGDGTLGTPVASVDNNMSGNATDLAEADFDGDGTLDVVSLTAGTAHLMTGDGDGTFTRTDFVPLGGGSFLYGRLVAGDLDGDGHPDLAIANGDSQVLVALNDGTGDLGAAVVVSEEISAYGVAAGDFDGDGDPDLVATGQGWIQAFANDGNGAFALSSQASAPGFSLGTSVAAADLNLDGHVDVVVTAGSVGVTPYYGAGDGSFAAGATIATSLGNHFGLLADDLSGDGKPDLAATDTGVLENRLAVRLNATAHAPVPEPLLIEVGEELPGEEPHVTRRRAGRVDFEHLATMAAGEGGEITLNLFENIEVIARQERVVWHDGARFTWFGRMVDYERDWAILVVDLDRETLTANVTLDGQPFQVRPVESGVHEAREIDHAGFPEGEDFTPPEEGSAGKAGQVGDAAGQAGILDSHPVIDILVVYTDDAAAASGDILGEILLAIEETNVGFEQSGVDAEVRLVGAEEVQYAESKDGRIDRNRVQNPSDGHLDQVAELRESYGADVVALWVEDPGPDLCGIAFIMEEVDVSFRSWAFFVVRRTCATGNYSFGHELGHVMGARHDRFVDDTDGKPFDYNHGYVNVADRWRTIMGYNDACDCSDESGTEPDTCPADEDRATSGPSCTRLLFWSEPGNTWNTPGNGQPGGPMGIASGSEAAHNVRTLNETAATVATFISDNVLTISGFVRHRDTGEGVAGVILDGLPLPDTTDADGYYEVLVPDEWSGIVTPLLAPYRFDPPQKTFSLLTQSAAQDFTAVPPPVIAGTITEAGTGLPIAGALVLGFPDEVVTDATGQFEGWVEFGWSGVLVALAAGYNMNPATRTLSNVLGDLAGQDFEGTAGVLADSDWPLVGRDQARTAAGTGSPVRPGTRWFYEDGSRWPSSPVVGPGGLVYVATSNGRLRALYPSGQPAWLESGAGPPDAGGLAVGAGGVLYMTQSSLDHLSSGAVSAVLPDGSGTAWSTSFQERVDVAPNLGASGTLYVGTSQGDLVAFDASDGTERWRFETEGGAVSAAALTGDETIVVGTQAGRLYAVNPDGTLGWMHDTGSTNSSAPALAPDGTVYIGSDDHRLYAVSADGALKWSFATGGPVRAVPAIGPGGEVYVGSDDGHLYAVSSGGQLRWKYRTGGPVTAGAAVSTHVSPFDPLLPGVEQTETVVYFGSGDGTVYAVNAGGTFTASMPGTLRWSVATDHPIEHAPALDFARQTLYVSSGPRLWAFGGQPTAGTGLVQITSLGTVLDPEILELRDNIHILVALAGEGGFGGSAILGGLPEDPCQGGPLFIPDCTELRSGLGTATPLVEVPSLVDLQIGFVKEGFGQAVLGGDPDGLLSTYTTVLRDGGTYTGILAGTTHPELLAPNPDGLPTRLTVFEAPTGTGSGTGEPVYVGHFSTDLGTIELRLTGSGTYTFGPLRYGELSDLAFVEPGAYEIQVVPLDGVAGKRQAALAASVDLAAAAGGPTGILLAGFADPEANLGGPGLTVYRADGGGETDVIGVAVGPRFELPQHGTLEPAYPNPFNPVTVIAYALPDERDVRLEVFDVLGRSVARLVDGRQTAGRHEVSFDAGRLAGGVYLVRLMAGGQVATRAVTLLK